MERCFNLTATALAAKKLRNGRKGRGSHQVGEEGKIARQERANDLFWCLKGILGFPKAELIMKRKG